MINGRGCLLPAALPPTPRREGALLRATGAACCSPLPAAELPSSAGVPVPQPGLGQTPRTMLRTSTWPSRLRYRRLPSAKTSCCRN